MIKLDRFEALRLIESLAIQLRENNPNSGRVENNNAEVIDAETGTMSRYEFFSISVHEKL